jgi:hypothetical protein
MIVSREIEWLKRIHKWPADMAGATITNPDISGSPEKKPIHEGNHDETDSVSPIGNSHTQDHK